MEEIRLAGFVGCMRTGWLETLLTNLTLHPSYLFFSISSLLLLSSWSLVLPGTTSYSGWLLRVPCPFPSFAWSTTDEPDFTPSLTFQSFQPSPTLLIASDTSRNDICIPAFSCVPFVLSFSLLEALLTILTFNAVSKLTSPLLDSLPGFNADQSPRVKDASRH